MSQHVVMFPAATLEMRKNILNLSLAKLGCKGKTVCKTYDLITFSFKYLLLRIFGTDVHLGTRISQLFPLAI